MNKEFQVVGLETGEIIAIYNTYEECVTFLYGLYLTEDMIIREVWKRL